MRREVVFAAGILFSWVSSFLFGGDRTIGGFPLGDQIHIRRKAESLAALVRSTKPTFAWNDADMLWIERDAHGQPRFALNHAYQLDGSGGWVLLDAPDGYVSSGMVDDLRQVSPGKLLSHDSRHGSVYLVAWPSHHQTGTGPVDCRRHVLLLCDRQNKWHFLGEGLGAIDGRASSKRIRTDVTYSVVWTDKCDCPLSMRATLSAFITAHNVERDDTTTFQSQRDYTLAGELPGVFVPKGDDYLITGPGDTRQLLSQRLAICDTFYPFERDPRRRSRMLQRVVDSIATLNPQLPRHPIPGTHVRLPDLESIWNDADSAAGPRKPPGAALAQATDD